MVCEKRILILDSKRLTKWDSCLCNRTTARFDFLHLFMVCRTAMPFKYIGRLVTNQQKYQFILSSLHFCLSFGFVFIRMRSWNPEISGFCVSEIRAVRTDHKRVQKIENQCCSVTQTINPLLLSISLILPHIPGVSIKTPQKYKPL